MIWREWVKRCIRTHPKHAGRAMQTQMIRNRAYPLFGPVEEIYLDCRIKNPAEFDDLTRHQRCGIAIYREYGTACSKKHRDRCLFRMYRRLGCAFAEQVVKRLATPVSDQSSLGGDACADAICQTLPYAEGLVSGMGLWDGHVYTI
jgi:hypothetical protein